MPLVCRGSFLTCLSLAFLGLSSAGHRLAAQSRPTFAVPPEPFAFRPGDALSLRTLVQRPPLLQGVLGWTIETRRHRGSLTVSALHPDGKILATGGVDGIVRIWDVNSGTFLRALVGHHHGVVGLAWSPDGNTLASTGGSDSSARLWDTKTGMTIRTLKGHKAYTHHVAWSPDGQSLVVAGGASGFVTLWDLTKGEQVRTVEVGNPISTVAWSPNNRDVAISGRASGVQVRELRENTSPFQGELPDQYGSAVAWSPDGKTIVGGSPTKTIVWDAESGKELHVLDTPAVGLAFSPDGANLAVTTPTDVKIWSTAAFTEKPKSVPVVSTRAVSWAPDSVSLFVTAAHVVARWSIEPLKAISQIDAAGDALVLTAPGRPIVTGLHTKTPTMWDPATAKPIAALEGHTSLVTTASWSRDGKFLATASPDKTVRVWDPAGKLIRTLAGHEAAVTCIAWADDKTLASGSVDKSVRIWNVTADAEPKVLPKQAGPITALAWTRDGRSLAFGGADKKVLVWPADADKPSLTLSTNSALRTLAWAPTGRSLAVAGQNGEMQIFTLPGGKVQQTFGRENSTPAISLAWGTDSVTLLTSRSHAAHVFKVGAPNSLLDINGLAPIAQVAWGLGGSMFLSCNDRSGRIYDQAVGGLLRITAVECETHLAIVSANGHYRVPDEAANELVYVVQTPTGQETMASKEFAARFRFRNLPASAALPGGK